jgi:polysaccharide chain length determinant protein (PEP-CTERM system associated)
MVPGRQYNVQYALRLLRKRWWIAIVPLLVIGTLAGVLAKALPNVFYAQTTILIVPQRIPESYVRSTVTVRLDERLASSAQKVLSRAPLEELIAEFDLYPVARQRLPMEVVVEWMRRSVVLRLAARDSFVVGYGGYDKTKVAPVADRLAELFVAESLREREMLADSTSNFLDSELQNARRRLAEQEQRVESFRKRYSGQLPSQLDSNLRILQSSYGQLQVVVETLNRDRDRRADLQRELDALKAPPAEVAPAQPAEAEEETGSNDPVDLPAGPALSRLEAARAQYARLEARLTPEHPDMVRLKRVIEDLEATVSASGTGSKAPATPVIRDARRRELQEAADRLDQQIAVREEQERRLRATVAMYQGRVEAVPERESEWADLTRDYATLQGVYTELLGKREQSRIAANLERRQVGEQFKVLEPARPPNRRASPNRPVIALTGAALGLGLGLALVVLIELRDTGLRTETEVLAALNLPMIGVLPRIVTPTERRRSKRRKIALSAAVGVCVVLVAALRWMI